jgi:hypothetical protein
MPNEVGTTPKILCLLAGKGQAGVTKPTSSSTRQIVRRWLAKAFLRRVENAFRRYDLDDHRPPSALGRRGLVGSADYVVGMSGDPGIDLGPSSFEPGLQPIRRWNIGGRYQNGADEQLPVDG